MVTIMPYSKISFVKRKTVDTCTRTVPESLEAKLDLKFIFIIGYDKQLINA